MFKRDSTGNIYIGVRNSKNENLSDIATVVAQVFAQNKRIPEQGGANRNTNMALAREKGGSSTLNTIPVAEHGFFFDAKADFHDHINLRYCWPLENLPTTCPCGESYTVDYSQICKLSGFIHMRHDDTTNFLASCMKEIHNNVETEPKLQPLTGKSLRHRTANTARANIRVRGFWTQGRNAFFDTRVSTLTREAIGPNPSSRFFRKWRERKKEYRERINEIEHASFTPLVFSACGGMDKEASVVVKRLAGDLATKRNESYSQVVGWMRCSLAFSLARSAIRCVCRSRSTRRRDIRQSPMDLIQAETRFECEWTVHVYPDSHKPLEL